MQHTEDLAIESVGRLFADTLTVERFKSWRSGIVEGVAATLDQYAFGEIFWRKSLGRPNTPKLSDGVSIRAWRDEMVLVGDVGGSAHWQPIRVPYHPSWWDGKDDGEYWRISYMVPNLTIGVPADGLPEHSTYTYILPHLKDEVPWKVPGGPFGVGHAGQRGLKPPSVAFVKEEGSVHFSFEGVLTSLFVSP